MKKYIYIIFFSLFATISHASEPTIRSSVIPLFSGTLFEYIINTGDQTITSVHITGPVSPKKPSTNIIINDWVWTGDPSKGIYSWENPEGSPKDTYVFLALYYGKDQNMSFGPATTYGYDLTKGGPVIPFYPPPTPVPPWDGGTTWDKGPLVPVPEPESYAMLLGGLGLMGAIARYRKNHQT